MALPIILSLVAIPIFLGIAYVTPFDQQPSEIESQETSSQIGATSILYLVLTVIWISFLVRILFQIKRGTFRVRYRY